MIPSLEDFLIELTELCQTYKVGIEDGTVYLSEPEDHLYEYFLDNDSKLVRK